MAMICAFGKPLNPPISSAYFEGEDKLAISSPDWTQKYQALPLTTYRPHLRRVERMGEDWAQELIK